jgi:hypothetical protein
MNSRDVIQATLLELQTWSAVLLALIKRLRVAKISNFDFCDVVWRVARTSGARCIDEGRACSLPSLATSVRPLHLSTRVQLPAPLHKTTLHSRRVVGQPSSVGRGAGTRGRGRSRAIHPRPGGRHHCTEPRLVGLITTGYTSFFHIFSCARLWAPNVCCRHWCEPSHHPPTTTASYSREAVERSSGSHGRMYVVRRSLGVVMIILHS